MFQHNRPQQPKPVRKMPTNPKPMLYVQQLPYFRVHYKTLEAYIKEVFGFDFDYLFSAGVALEGPAIDYKVSGTFPSAAWVKRADDLRQGRRTRDISLILNVLAQDNYIPAGHYTVATTKLPDPTTVYTQLLREHGPDSPQCVEFREQHANDKVFVQRSMILDKAYSEAIKSAQ